MYSPFLSPYPSYPIYTHPSIKPPYNPTPIYTTHCSTRVDILLGRFFYWHTIVVVCAGILLGWFLIDILLCWCAWAYCWGNFLLIYYCGDMRGHVMGSNMKLWCWAWTVWFCGYYMFWHGVVHDMLICVRPWQSAWATCCYEDVCADLFVDCRRFKKK